ncbi:MAG: rod shape-determining protein MreD [Bryobacterales bacterium]|nr:rod shape-determining protein MreD [Bryobacterales bacterium]
MTGFSDHLLGARASRPRKYQLRPVALIVAPIVALILQLYIPVFVTQFAFLELPLLVTVYFALMRRDQVAGILIGCTIGIVQDALSHNPLGMFGIVKTLVGYFAAFMSQRLDVENPFIRFVLCFFLFFFHQFFYWVLVRTLLAQPMPMEFGTVLLFGILNGAVAVPLFALLDRL